MQLSPSITAKEDVLELLVAELRHRLPAEQASAPVPSGLLATASQSPHS